MAIIENEKVRSNYALDDDLMPCGHTVAQAAWLGCTEDECRPQDRLISEAYLRDREARGR